jgi:hypothetical protein
VGMRCFFTHGGQAIRYSARATSRISKNSKASST